MDGGPDLIEMAAEAKSSISEWWMMMSQELYEKQSDALVMEKMLAGSGYSDKAIRYFMEKPYIGAIPDADQVSEMTGTCGTP